MKPGFDLHASRAKAVATFLPRYKSSLTFREEDLEVGPSEQSSKTSIFSTTLPLKER